LTEKFQIETSAGGVVYRKKDDYFEWLVIQHAGAKHWGFPKGHVADKIADEKLEDAALREVSEEGGIQARIISPDPISASYVYKMNKILRKKTVHYFVMEYLSGDPQDHDNEIQEAKFLPTEEVMNTLTYDTDKESFQKALLILGN
jgi:ADP-ribose pyrophosphatase YjhB (NUDIX family)